MDASRPTGAAVRLGNGNLADAYMKLSMDGASFSGPGFYGPIRTPEELAARMQPTNLGDRYLEHIKSPYDLLRYQTQPRVEVDQHAAKRISRLITAAGRQARPL